MSPTRLATGLAAAAVLAAALLTAVRQAHAAGEGDAPVVQAPARPATAAARPAGRVPPARPNGAAPTAASAQRPAVDAGVLVRAASKRAQDREAAGVPASSRTRRGSGSQESIVSVEIQWHGSNTSQ